MAAQRAESTADRGADSRIGRSGAGAAPIAVTREASRRGARRRADCRVDAAARACGLGCWRWCEPWTGHPDRRVPARAAHAAARDRPDGHQRAAGAGGRDRRRSDALALGARAPGAARGVPDLGRVVDGARPGLPPAGRDAHRHVPALDPLAPAYLLRRRTGDLVSAVTGDVETVEFFFAHTIAPAFVAVLVPGGVLIALAVHGLAAGAGAAAVPGRRRR